MSETEEQLTFEEFRRVCVAAGVDEEAAGEMEYDYAIGQAVGNAIDRMCVLAEESNTQDLDHARNSVDAFLGDPTTEHALEAAARLIRWAGEQSLPKESKDEN